MSEILPKPRQGWLLFSIIVTLGHALKKIEEFLFDYMLYPIVIAWAMLTYGSSDGMIIGGIIMGIASAAICMLWLWIYFLLKVDFLAVEYARLVRDYDGSGGMWSKFRSLILRSKILAFFFLSLVKDPFVTIAYVRHGASDDYDGLSLGDWIIFWLSVIIANAWWTGLMGAGIEFLNQYFPGLVAWLLSQAYDLVMQLYRWLGN